jgi:DNA-directed RNA polymerase subunit RPC12/RpoP
MAMEHESTMHERRGRCRICGVSFPVLEDYGDREPACPYCAVPVELVLAVGATGAPRPF